LLPARLAASDVDSGSEVSGHRGRAGRARHPAKAEQSDHGHLAAPEHFAIGNAESVLSGYVKRAYFDYRKANKFFALTSYRTKRHLRVRPSTWRPLSALQG